MGGFVFDIFAVKSNLLNKLRHFYKLIIKYVTHLSLSCDICTFKHFFRMLNHHCSLVPQPQDLENDPLEEEEGVVKINQDVFFRTRVWS